MVRRGGWWMDVVATMPPPMDFLFKLIDTLRHLDKLQEFISQVGASAFLAVILIVIFCETGLVVLPLLPGDSLLFAVGTIGAGASPPYSLLVLGPAIMAAALCGDNVNYWLGRKLGPKVFSVEEGEGATTAAAKGWRAKLFNRKHLVRTQAFYDKYGTKTIILARFVPIVRTFAPFVAGIGQMPYPKFLLFSVLGAAAWVTSCLSAGYFLANVEFVKKHFEIVALAIVFISVLPMGVEFVRHRRASGKLGASGK